MVERPSPINSRVNSRQVEAEKSRAYDALKQDKGGNGWKEINAAIARIMRDYCGQYKTEQTLKLGLRLLNELKTTELASAYASNPHELGRLLECHAIISVGELAMKSSLERKASNSILDFHRLDYPEMDPPECNKFITLKLEKNMPKTGELPFRYWLQAPYASSYEENYQEHCSL